MGRLDRYPKLEAAGPGLCLRLASSPWARLVGLAGIPSIEAQPLLIPRCRSVHTFGMRFDIDVVFLRCPPGVVGGAEVVAVKGGLRPFRHARSRNANAVLELTSGQALDSGLTEGRRLLIVGG